MEEDGSDSGNESPETDRMTWTTLSEPEKYQPRDPLSLVPALAKPKAASASTSSGDGARASSGSRSSGYLRRSGRNSGPGSRDPNREADLHLPVTVNDAGPGPSGAEGGVATENQPVDSLAIIEVAYHRRTGCMFVLINTTTGLAVSRIPKNDLDCIDLSFSVGRNHENQDRHQSYSDHRQGEGRMRRITVVGDYIVVRIKRNLAVHNLGGLGLGEVEVKELVDASGFDQTVYCLLEGGRVANYSLPDLDQETVTTVQDIEQASEISTCPETGRIAILNPSSQTVAVYDSHMDLISTVVLQKSCENICLCADELLLGSCEKKGDCCYVDYTLATAAWVVLLHPHTSRNDKWLGRIGSEWHRIRFCVLDEDHLLCNFGHHIGQLDLYDIRRRGVACTRTNTDIIVGHELPRVLVSTHNRWYSGHEHSIYCIALHKITDELLVLSKSGLVRVYSRDLTRPAAEYDLQGFSGHRLDTTDQGEVAAIIQSTELGHVGGYLKLFSPDRQLRSSVGIARRPLDVVCSEDKIYVLVDDSVIVYSTIDRRIEETRRFHLRLRSVKPFGTKLAVDGDVLYMWSPRIHHVLRLNLGDPVPTFTPFIENLHHDQNMCLAVTETGDVVVGAWKRLDRQCIHHGLRIHSPAGKCIKKVTTDISPDHLILCPGGGAFIATDDGDIRYIDI